jgi:hypothetical protein
VSGRSILDLVGGCGYPIFIGELGPQCAGGFAVARLRHYSLYSIPKFVSARPRRQRYASAVVSDSGGYIRLVGEDGCAYHRQAMP